MRFAHANLHNLFSRPCRTGKRAREKAAGDILGRRDIISSDGKNFRTGRYEGQEPGRQSVNIPHNRAIHI